jgi:hypothetical protein
MPLPVYIFNLCHHSHTTIPTPSGTQPASNWSLRSKQCHTGSGCKVPSLPSSLPWQESQGPGIAQMLQHNEVGCCIFGAGTHSHTALGQLLHNVQPPSPCCDVERCLQILVFCDGFDIRLQLHQQTQDMYIGRPLPEQQHKECFNPLIANDLKGSWHWS